MSIQIHFNSNFYVFLMYFVIEFLFFEGHGVKLLCFYSIFVPIILTFSYHLTFAISLSKSHNSIK